MNAAAGGSSIGSAYRFLDRRRNKVNGALDSGRHLEQFMCLHLVSTSKKGRGRWGQEEIHVGAIYARSWRKRKGRIFRHASMTVGKGLKEMIYVGFCI